ncbi:YbiU family protein, partial [Burkholderia mallei]
MPFPIDDLPAAIRTTKAVLRAAMPNRAPVFRALEGDIARQADAILTDRAQGRDTIPVLRFADIAADRVDPASLAALRTRGACVIRGVFDARQASDWNDEIAAYVEANRLDDKLARRAEDRYFGTLASSRPQIYGIYWSKPQIAARQSPALTRARVFLNRLWRAQSEGRVHFDPARAPAYADRIRRRPPGSSSLGLSPHVDGGSVERWLEPNYRRVYRHVLAGDWRAYDPFDAAFRPDVEEIPSPAVCSMFRTFQGWTALTPQGPGDGTLQLIPVANAMAYVVLRALQDDVPDDDLCGAQPGRALSVLPAWHAPLLAALVPIPPMEPGDAVFWHGDVVHAVEDAHRGTGYSNVMYIASAPGCAKND